MNVIVANGVTRQSNPPSKPSEREVRASCVYGDSTPFPHEGNFIETVRHAVECGVALMSAQHVIVKSGARAADIERARQVERGRLEQMANGVKRALLLEMAGGSERLQRTGGRINDATRIAADAEIGALEAMASEELQKARIIKDGARMSALRALETFLLRHDLPGTEVGLRILAGESTYASQAVVGTPFGVEAVFDLVVPAAHEWGRVRRVGDLTSGVEVHVPLESGLFFKRIEVQALRLDRLYFSTLHLKTERSVLTLRKQPRSGTGYKLVLDSTKPQQPPRVLIGKIDEDGTESADEAIELHGEDMIHVLRLWQRVLDSTSDLSMRRHAMSSALVDGRPIHELDEPQLVCERLVRAMSPVVREIARRSGAPGELVLRRTVSAGRRDEIYITKAELHEKVMTLAPPLRAVFEPFELDSPRSPRAPAPSVPAYVELADEDVQALEPSRVEPLPTS